MNLYIQNHPYHYEMENLTHAFFFAEDVRVIREYDEPIEPYILTAVDDAVRVEIGIDGSVDALSAPLSDDDELTKQVELLMKLLPAYPTRTDDGGTKTVAKKTNSSTFGELVGSMLTR